MSSAVLPVAGARVAEGQAADDQVEASPAIPALAVGGRVEGQCLVPCEAPDPVGPTIPDNLAETASR